MSHDTTVPALLQQGTAQVSCMFVFHFKMFTGIFSDLHMLSLMYAGEMCHWYWELNSAPSQPTPSKDDRKTQPGASLNDHDSSKESTLWCVMELTQGIEFARDWRDNFNSQKYGIEFLSKYVDVARGPLKDQSWNYVQAVQLLVSLRKANSVSK